MPIKKNACYAHTHTHIYIYIYIESLCIRKGRDYVFMIFYFLKLLCDYRKSIFLEIFNFKSNYT